MIIKSLAEILLAFILKNMITLQTGTLLLKLKSVFNLSLLVSPFAYIIDSVMVWSVEHKSYILFVFGAIFVDHVLGSFKHAFVLRDFTFKKNITGVAVKIGLAVCMGFLFEGVKHLMEGDSFIQDYLEIVLRLTVFLYPAGSAFMNSAVLTNGKFPPMGWISILNNFNKNLDLKTFKKEDDNNNDQFTD